MGCGGSSRAGSGEKPERGGGAAAAVEARPGVWAQIPYDALSIGDKLGEGGQGQVARRRRDSEGA
jgi:hypothetical protein